MPELKVAARHLTGGGTARSSAIIHSHMTCKISSVSPEREAPSVHLFPCREASELASNAFYHHSWYIRTLSAVVLLLNFSPVISLWYFCSTTKIFECVSLVKPLRVASEKLEFSLLIAVVHILLNLSFWHTSALGSSHSIIFLQKILGTEQLTVCQPPSAISIYIDSLYLCLSSTVCMVGIAFLSRDSTPSWLQSSVGTPVFNLCRFHY